MKKVVYKGTNGEWRWRLVARNGKIIATSHEEFSKMSNAIRAVKRVDELLKATSGEVVIEYGGETGELP